MKKVKSYAKVNLLLKVIEKKENVYHELQMVNNKVNLCDEITIEYSEYDEVYISNDIDTSFIKNVLTRIKEKYSIKKSYKITIDKNIPIGAGLGGASVNAATIIDTILTLENIDDKAMNKINNFKDLGADIPYAFFNDDAIVEGIGEKIYIIEKKITKPLVLVNPNIFVSTKEVFEKNKKYSCKYTHEYIMNNIDNDSLYINELEESSFELNDVLRKLKLNLSKYGKTVMSGTGSSFIVHSDKYQQIKEEFPDYLVIKIN